MQSVHVRIFPSALEVDIEGKNKVFKEVRANHEQDGSKLFMGPKRTRSTNTLYYEEWLELPALLILKASCVKRADYCLTSPNSNGVRLLAL